MKEEKKNGGDGLLQPRDAEGDKTEEDDEKKEKHGRSQTKQKVKKTKPSEPLRIPRNYQTVDLLLFVCPCMIEAAASSVQSGDVQLC